MTIPFDFSIANSSQIEKALCQRLEKIRLTHNLTQAQLAKQAGVSLRTITRLEKGEGISLDTLIRVMSALDLQGNLQNLLPDPAIRPIERVETGGHERKRARPQQTNQTNAAWTWGDEKDSTK
jgi:transcriptional regulator with XRE-family HTH domain